MVTIRDVARKAQVSVGTVSHVTSGAVRVRPELRERVLKAARELNYQPNHTARSLKTRQTRILGMVISDITNPFFPQVVRGAEDIALKHNYLLVTLNTDDHLEREKHILSMLRTRRVDGILLVVAPNQKDVSHIKSAIAAGIPMVCLDRVPPGVPVDSVSTDNVKGAEMCVRHLLALGHRRIGIITGTVGLSTASDRLRGCQNALTEAGITPDRELIREGDFREETGYVLCKSLCLSRKRPTAVFVSNAMMGLGALKAITELGLRCPEDIAIAIFDDLPLAGVFQPHLTAVAQPAYAIGSKGAELLLKRIETKAKIRKPVKLLLEPELKVRESTRGNESHFREK